MWLIYGTVAAILLPLAPPSGHYALATWMVAVAIVIWSFLAGRHLLRPPKVGFNTLLAGSYVAVGQLARSRRSPVPGRRVPGAVPAAGGLHGGRASAPQGRALPARAVGGGLSSAPLPGRDLGHGGRPGVRLFLWLALSGLDDGGDRAAAIAAHGVAGGDRPRAGARPPGPAHGARQPPAADGGPGSAPRRATRGPAARPRDVDLDGFKAYNDTYGHATGDALLKRLGDKLAATMAGRGQSYRMGGDEFCVLATVAAHEAPETVDCAAQALSDRGHGFEVRASCGWVLLPDEQPGTLRPRCASQTGACTRRRTSAARPPAGRRSTCC